MSRYRLIINKVDAPSDILFFEIPDDPGTYKLKFNPKGGGDPLDGGTVVVGNKENTYKISAKLTNGTIINTGTFTTPKARYTITIENASWGTVYNGDIAIKSGDRVLSGSVLTITSTATAGYTSTVSSSTGTISNNQLTVNGNETITFNRKGVTYYVKFNGNGATSGSMGNQSFVYGTSKKLTANAFKRSHTVTYDYNGGTESKTSDTVTAVFNGWSKTSSGSVVYENEERVDKLTTIAESTVNLYANWTLGSVTLPTPTKTGYDFKGWATSSTATSGTTGRYTVSSDVTLYAIWKIKEYSLTMPIKPEGVSSYYISRTPSTVYTGAPKTQTWAGASYEKNQTIYYGDTLIITATKENEFYNVPTYQLRYDSEKGGGTSCVIGQGDFEDGEVFVYIKGNITPGWKTVKSGDTFIAVQAYPWGDSSCSNSSLVSLLKEGLPTKITGRLEIYANGTTNFYSGINYENTESDNGIYTRSYSGTMSGTVSVSIQIHNGKFCLYTSENDYIEDGEWDEDCGWINVFGYNFTRAYLEITKIEQYYSAI